MIGPITLDLKQAGKRSAGKPHAAFDVAGAGNVTMVAGLRSTTKVMGLPPAPTVRAPALDPTDERCALKARGIQSFEIMTAAKLSSQPRTESCVMSGNGHCEA